MPRLCDDDRRKLARLRARLEASLTDIPDAWTLAVSAKVVFGSYVRSIDAEIGTDPEDEARIDDFDSHLPDADPRGWLEADDRPRGPVAQLRVVPSLVAVAEHMKAAGEPDERLAVREGCGDAWRPEGSVEGAEFGPVHQRGDC